MIAGDVGNVMVRSQSNPVSWPEIGLLQHLHGEEAVYNIEVVESVKSTSSQEKLRLTGIYDPQAVELIYPGKSPVMEMEMPGTSAPGEETIDPKAGTKTSRRTTSIPPLTADEE